MQVGDWVDLAMHRMKSAQRGVRRASAKAAIVPQPSTLAEETKAGGGEYEPSHTADSNSVPVLPALE